MGLRAGQEILVNPKFLSSKGITVHKVLQMPGEFIVSAPGVRPPFPIAQFRSAKFIWALWWVYWV